MGFGGHHRYQYLILVWVLVLPFFKWQGIRLCISFPPHLSTLTISHLIRCQWGSLQPLCATLSTNTRCETQTHFCSWHLLRTLSFARFHFSYFLCNCLVLILVLSCLTAIRRENKAFISGQHKYAYFCRLRQLLRIPAAKIARYGFERRDVECLQNALIPLPPTTPPPPLPPNTLVNLKSAMPGFVRQAV